MHDGYVLRPQHLVHGLFLGGVEPGKSHGLKAVSFCFPVRVEEVAQISQAVVLGFHRAVEGVEHHLVACEGEVFQHLLFCLPVCLRGFSFPCLKEHDGSSELKVVFDVLVFGTEHLYGVLVERVVEAFSYA